MITVSCKYCKKRFNTYPSRIKNGKGKFCSKECYSKWMSENNRGENSPSWKGGKTTLYCEYCGNPFKVKSYRKYTARFCSGICRAKWMSETFRGKDSFNWKPRDTRKCRYCGKDFEIEPYMPNNQFCNRACYIKWLKSPIIEHPLHKDKIDMVCVGCGKKFKIYPYQKHNDKWLRKYCSKKCYIKNVTTPTGPEEKFIEICKRHLLPFDYVGNGEFWLGSLNPDFVNKDKKTVIEIFGRYWHQDKGNIGEKQTYEGRKRYFEKLGWRCIILWEDEVDDKVLSRPELEIFL